MFGKNPRMTPLKLRKQLLIANARHRNPINFKRRIGCAQGDRLSDQAIGAQRVMQFADSQYRPWMRFDKRPLCLTFTIAIQDRATENKDDYGASEDKRTQASPREGRQPPQRQPSAILHRLFEHPVL